MDWLKSFVKSIAENEVVSWFSHWIVAGVIVFPAVGLLGLAWGYIVAQLVLVVFVAREVENYFRLKKLKDSLMDLVGPTLIWIILSYVVLA